MTGGGAVSVLRPSGLKYSADNCNCHDTRLGLATEWIEIDVTINSQGAVARLGLATEWIEIYSYRSLY